MGESSRLSWDRLFQAIVINQEVKFDYSSFSLIIIQGHSYSPSMTPSSLGISLQGLRGLVEREELTINILRTIDSFSIQIAATEKHWGQLEAEVKLLRIEEKKLRNRAKRLENEVCQCRGERDNLALELQKAQDLHRFKMTQLLQKIPPFTAQPYNERRQKKEAKVRKTSFGTQCQIWSESTISELQEKSQLLQLKADGLQLRCEQQFREGIQREDLIHQLLLVLSTETASPHHQQIEQDEKENDNSTLDNDSQKQEDFQLPEWLEEVQSESSESVRDSDEQEEEEEEEEENPYQKGGWLWRLRECSSKLRSFIFG